MKNIALFFLIFVISACQSAPALNETTPISTIVPVTQTFKPTFTPEPPTETPNPLANAPEGTTGFDNNGEPIREVTYENGQTFEFHLNEQREWVRRLNKSLFYLLDGPSIEGIPMTISMKDGVPGGEYILSVDHQPVDSLEDQSPISSAAVDPLVRRLKGISAPQLTQNMEEMRKYIDDIHGTGIEYSIILPNGTEEGKKVTAKFGNRYGINMLLVPSSDLEPLVEQKLAVKFTLYDTEVIYAFDGVTDNSVSCRISSTTPLNEIKGRSNHDRTYILSRLMFVCFAALMDGEDVRLEYENSIDHTLALVSEHLRKNNAPDLLIQFADE